MPQSQGPVAGGQVPGEGAEKPSEGDSCPGGKPRKQRQGEEQRAHPQLAAEALAQPDPSPAGDCGVSSGGGHPTLAARISSQRSRTAPRPAGLLDTQATSRSTSGAASLGAHERPAIRSAGRSFTSSPM